MPGRRGSQLLALAAGLVLVASGATASAATERIAASKARAVTGPSAELGAAVAKKKKKKKKKAAPATTQSSQVAFVSGTTVSSTASCTGATHMTGGGFTVAPSFGPPGTGIRSVTSTSYPTGPTGWHASGSAFSTPLVSGSFTTHVQCESNSLGKLASIVSQTTTLAPASAFTFNFTCPPGTHALSGGYAGAGVAGFAYQAQNFRIIPLQSRRTSPTQWTVQAANSSFATASATLVGYVVCEQDAKGRTISEVSSFTALVNDARASGDPACTSGKQHVVSGGFVLSPNAPGPQGIPSFAIDEFQPVGKGTWHIGGHEIVGFTLPAGSSLQSFAYCAPDNPPKKKKRKRRR